MRAWSLATALLLTAVAPTSVAAPTAPPAAAPAARPCTVNGLCLCRSDHIACDAVPFHRFPDTESGVRHVAVSRARLGSLPDAALDGRRLRTLVLVASRLHHIESAALASMDSTLASLDLSYNEFTNIPIEALRTQKVLNWLNLQNNLIAEIDPQMEWVFLSDSLSSLLLSNNQLSYIREGTLTSLRQLAQLELDGNRLRHIEANSLPASLALLRLSANLLSTVPCAALASLTRLRHLHLRNNALAATFTANRSCRAEGYRIDSLDLSHNDLTDNFQFAFTQGLQLKQLALDLNDFTSIPSFVFECGRIEKLSISYNELSHLSETAILTLKRDLERLELDNNEITSLPRSMQELTRLRHLSLSYNELREVPWLPPQLRYLSLAGNYLEGFPLSLNTLEPATLRYLDIGYNRITHVTSEWFGPWSGALSTLNVRGNRISHLTGDAFPAALPLTELVFSFNDLYYVEASAFANLTSLRVLELSSTLFSGEVPAGPAFQNLKWLTLDNNNIHFFSSNDMKYYSSLEYLNLDFNKLLEFPSQMFETITSYRLKELRLSYNYISRVNPVFLTSLSDLHSLDLSYNRVHNVSERTFSKLTSLIYLSLVGNDIEIIANNAFSDLPKLEILDLQENNLVEFSTRFFRNVSNEESNFSINVSHNMISLLVGGPNVSISILDLSHNLIETVSRSFFESFSKHVRQILLSYNRLVHVDASGFGHLPRLLNLDLHHNNISTIRRKSFAELVSLQILDLSDNRLNQLSVEQFYNLQKLRHLRLESNEIRALPRDCFKNTLLESLELGNNRLALFPSTALAQVGFTLRRLHLPANRLEHLDAAMFHEIPFLHELNLAHNALTVLSDNTFSGLSRLQLLDLSYNYIKTNYKELFHNLPRLRRLAMAGIGLRTIPHMPLVNLTELNLNNNLITSYQEIDVRHLADLRALDLARNHITTLRPAMWAALPRLAALDVSSNPIVRITSGAFDGLHRLLHLRLDNLQNLEAVEPRAFRTLVSLRSLALESPAGRGRGAATLADITAAVPCLEALTVVVRVTALEAQLLGVRAPRLRLLEVRGGTMRRVAANAFSALGRQRALTLRLSGTGVSALPAGLARPLARVPHLALDLSDNRLVSFSPATLYPNLTGWNRLATKLLPGGLVLAGNPLRCGCAASWVGAWLRRWTAEVGGGGRAARAAARRNHCRPASPLANPRPLLALDADDAECHASALASAAPYPQMQHAPRLFLPLLLQLLLLLPHKLIYKIVFS
ncbi:Chaoptin [Papilio machaon]|uniref:Chaoptin n=1 Tax=Papilio machaon TaxID=76193 RepID=A0A0N0PE55_PAPMA|nr:Chaoptin [Papilio machaon]